MFPQWLLILTALVIPSFLYKKGKHEYLVSWLVIVCFVDIFNSQQYLNLTAFKLAGVVLIPHFLWNIKNIYQSRLGKIFYVFIFYLTILSVIYGVFFPWEDISGTRIWKDLPLGRTSLYMGSLFLHFMVVFYLATVIKEKRNYDFFIKSFALMAVVVPLGILAEKLFRIDMYHFMTLGPQMLEPGRMRGFNYEPRGASQACAYLLIFLLGDGLKLSMKFRFFLIVFLMMSMQLATAVTGIIIFIAGILILLFYKLWVDRSTFYSYLRNLIAILFVLIISVFSLDWIAPEVIKEYKYQLSYKLESILRDRKQETFASRFEWIDASAVNFLSLHPQYLWFGVGPGLISLPSSGTPVERDKKIRDINKTLALPHMGIVLLISNGGIFGTILWLLMLIIFLSNYWKNYKLIPSDIRDSLFIILIVLVLCYFIQLRDWVFLGMAIGFGYSMDLKIIDSSYLFTKRMIDLIFAFTVIGILLPVFPIIACLIKVTSHGPVIHWSRRIGINNKLFLMPKFRTMSLGAPQKATHLLDNSKNYITMVGRFLRKTSLDELPQCWSILKGDMTLVGPRPALFNQEDLIKLRTMRNIQTLVPGITGWGQINGRDDISILEKVKLDEEYLNRKSAALDLKIIIYTFLKVVWAKNISH